MFLESKSLIAAGNTYAASTSPFCNATFVVSALLIIRRTTFLTFGLPL